MSYPPTDEEVGELLSLLGLATFQAQSLEYQVVTLFATAEVTGKGASPGSDVVRELMDTRYRQTLGRLARDAAKDLGLEAELAEQLEEALAERNWLIHRFYREFAPAATSRLLFSKAMARLSSVASLLEEVSTAVYEEAIRRFIESGLSEEELSARASRATAQYLREHLE